MEAFRGLIEHLWNPFGGVEVDVVDDNIFMFYFKILEDRNRVWQRGPWHFDNCLIVLEKPEGLGDITKLKVGHGLRDCPDDEARSEVLKIISTKFGSWLRASMS
ncbi:hypothetical protein Dsin_008532 [Dipteronia sinensis]|uniref:DUF4283 domain-containing protein n=1 Tax=Dipteronia sinensis TaxID=43782 RepID=A0AAE0AP73_9ROSI|nr:hypothetical protein Dsin_008532 [Dipteronia sinensis]